MADGPDDSIATRATLLERLKDCSDQSSWQRFYDTYRGLIHDFAIKAGLTETEAQDVVQETVIGVARNLPEFRYEPTKCAFKTWLLNLTMWRVKDQIRRRMPLRGRDGPEQADADGTATVDRAPDPAAEQWQAQWEIDWRKTVLAAALERVKADANLKDCQMFELLAFRGWPPAQVA